MGSASTVLALVKPESVDAEPRVRNKSKFCTFDGCWNLRKAGELCEGHMYYQRAGRALVPLRNRPPRQKNTELICAFESCGKKRFVAELCGAHYAQRQKGQALKPAGTCGLRVCSKCKDPNKPRTDEFFGVKSVGGDLDSVCRSCCREETSTLEAAAAYMRRHGK